MIFCSLVIVGVLSKRRGRVLRTPTTPRPASASASAMTPTVRLSLNYCTKTKSPQTNGIVERFHKTVLDEFYRIAFRKKIYGSIADLQVDLDRWVQSYNEERPHQGRWCFGKTPMQTFL